MKLCIYRQTKNLLRKRSLLQKYHHQLVPYRKEQVSSTVVLIPRNAFLVVGAEALMNAPKAPSSLNSSVSAPKPAPKPGSSNTLPMDHRPPATLPDIARSTTPVLSNSTGGGGSLLTPIPPSIANNKFNFPGEQGFGIRIQRPKGPRPEPDSWSRWNFA